MMRKMLLAAALSVTAMTGLYNTNYENKVAAALEARKPCR